MSPPPPPLFPEHKLGGAQFDSTEPAVEAGGSIPSAALWDSDRPRDDKRGVGRPRILLDVGPLGARKRGRGRPRAPGWSPRLEPPQPRGERPSLVCGYPEGCARAAYFGAEGGAGVPEAGGWSSSLLAAPGRSQPAVGAHVQLFCKQHKCRLRPPPYSSVVSV